MVEERTIKAAQRRILELEAEIARLRVELAEAVNRGREELLASEEKRLAVFENILDVYYEVGLDGTILEISPSVASVSRYRREDLLGTSIWDLYPDRGERERLIAELRRRGAVREFEIHLLDKGGAVVDCAVTARLREGRDGLPPRICGILKEITGRVQAREAQARVNRELEHQVRQRAAELEFLVRALSHDLRTPLVSVRGFAGLLNRRLPPEDEELRAYATRIADAGAWLEALVDDLQDLFAPRDRRREARAVDLGDVVYGAAGVVMGRGGEPPVAIEVAPDLPAVRGDERLIRRVLENLLTNAIKYTGGQATPRVRVGARVSGGDAVVWVSDNGAGIDPADRERVFDLYERLGAAGEGAGVGLGIVRRFVEAQGGRVWVESQGRDQGSTFLFTLPLADSA